MVWYNKNNELHAFYVPVEALKPHTVLGGVGLFFYEWLLQFWKQPLVYVKPPLLI